MSKYKKINAVRIKQREIRGKAMIKGGNKEIDKLLRTECYANTIIKIKIAKLHE